MFKRLLSVLVFVFSFSANNGFCGDAKVECRIYDVSDLTREHRYCALPLSLLSEDRHFENPFLQRNQTTVITCQNVSDIFRTRVRPESWATEKGTTVEERGGKLVVCQTADVHDEIVKLLTQFRSKSLQQIAVMGMLVLAVDVPRETVFSGGDFEKFLGANGAQSAMRVVCFNSQRAHSRSVRVFSYINGHEVNGASMLPEIRKGFEGWIFDANPVASDDGRTVTVDLRFIQHSSLDNSQKNNISFAPPVAFKDKPAWAGFETDAISIHSLATRTQVRVPSGKWVMASVFQNPKSDAKEKNLLLFVSAEQVPANPYLKVSPESTVARAAEALGNQPDNGAVEMRIFDVRDICANFPHYPARVLPPTNAIANPFGAPPVATGWQATDLADFIRRIFSKQFEDPTFSIEVSNDKLVVLNRPKIHEAIALFLGDFRKVFCQQVSVKSRLLATREIPVDSIIDNDGMNRLAAAEGNVVVASPQFVAFNKQVAHIKNGRENNAATRLDVSGDFCFLVMEKIFDGLLLEATAIVLSSNAAVQLDLDFELSSNFVKTKRSLGLPANSGATPSAILPPGSSSSGESKKYVTPLKKIPKGQDKENIIEESKSSSTTESGRVLGPQYISGVEFDTHSINSNGMLSQIVVPEGKWVLAGSFNNPDPKGPKHLLLYVSADVIPDVDEKK